MGEGDLSSEQATDSLSGRSRIFGIRIERWYPSDTEGYGYGEAPPERTIPRA
jgi:hypothetical protein